jgi:hypothetical protein
MEMMTVELKDLLERGAFEVAEDRRIAALMCEERNRAVLLQRASVTEELMAAVVSLMEGRYPLWDFI